jgi:hypothetical protein
MTDADFIKKAADQVLGESPSPESPVKAPTFAPENMQYLLLYKVAKGLQLPFNNPESLKSMTADQIEAAGGFSGNGDNFAWDNIYWIFDVPGEDGQPVTCCYSAEMEMSGALSNEDHLAMDTQVKNPEGQILDNNYLRSHFQGQFPFQRMEGGKERINLTQFSDADTKVLPEHVDNPASIPITPGKLGHLREVVQEKGKPLTSLTSNAGSYRIWVEEPGKEGYMATIDGKKDEVVMKDIAIAKQTQPAQEQQAPGKEDEQVFEPQGEGAAKPEDKEDERFAQDSKYYQGQSDAHKKLSDSYNEVADTMKKIETGRYASAADLARVFLASKKSEKPE